MNPRKYYLFDDGTYSHKEPHSTEYTLAIEHRHLKPLQDEVERLEASRDYFSRDSNEMRQSYHELTLKYEALEQQLAEANKVIESAHDHLTCIDCLKEGFEEDYIPRATKQAFEGAKITSAYLAQLAKKESI